jgi:Leucine-rich repeat (LRR) protein
MVNNASPTTDRFGAVSLQAALRHRGITASTLLFHLQTDLHSKNINAIRALDLSFNKIESISRNLPSSLIALNLSHNCIREVSIKFKPAYKLIELNLSFNCIER